MNVAPTASSPGVSAASLKRDNVANSAASVNTQNSAPRRAEQRTETPAAARSAQQPRDAYEPSAEARAAETRQRELARDTSSQRDSYGADRQPARAQTENSGRAVDLVG
jgi:hypothetical protein